jgi:hypothetical protein
VTGFPVSNSARHTALGSSLVPERYHRVEARGFVGGPDAEEQADGYRYYDA